MKILIIEDEVLIQQSLKKLIEKFKAHVDVASTGKDAIKLIKSKKYDRIVCDLMLNDITGFDIIESSKELMSPEEISKIFIIMTAYSSESVIEKAQAYNCILLNKPFEDLKEAITIIIEGKNEN